MRLTNRVNKGYYYEYFDIIIEGGKTYYISLKASSKKFALTQNRKN